MREKLKKMLTAVYRWAWKTDDKRKPPLTLTTIIILILFGGPPLTPYEGVVIRWMKSEHQHTLERARAALRLLDEGKRLCDEIDWSRQKEYLCINPDYIPYWEVKPRDEDSRGSANWWEHDKWGDGNFWVFPTYHYPLNETPVVGKKEEL